MLSYRHAFHAGNFADVLKHIVLIEILEHLIKKETAFDYIDTHAGAGIYDLRSRQTAKLHEYRDGIAKLATQPWPELSSYREVLHEYNEGDALRLYPGSPLIAKHYLRAQDRAWLYELHPKDFELLAAQFPKRRRVKVIQGDGFEGMLSIVPPSSRRGLVFIDPPYEVKADYTRVFKAVATAYRKFAGGIYAVWYPVVDRKNIDRLDSQFVRSGIKKIQRFELDIGATPLWQGMHCCGVYVINPPWTLMDALSPFLPKLANTLGVTTGGAYRSEVLVGE